MGLDMYIYGVKFCDYKSKYSDEDNVEKSQFTEIKIEEVYWRKSNQIHQWFVKNVQGGNDDCNYYAVSIEQLKELVKTCEKVLEDHSLAEKLLPTTSGFFFGSTEYDDWYFNDVEYTVKHIKRLLKEYEELDYDYLEYHSSW